MGWDVCKGGKNSMTTSQQKAYNLGVLHFINDPKNKNKCPYISESGGSAERTAYFDGWYDQKHKTNLSCDWEMKTQPYWNKI